MVPKAVRNRVRLAQQRAAAEITAPMPRQKTCRLGGDHATLDAGQRRLGFVERQTDHLQPVVALVEMQDYVFADHTIVVIDNPELDLEAHSRPISYHCWSANLSADTAADHHDLPHFAMVPRSCFPARRGGSRRGRGVDGTSSVFLARLVDPVGAISTPAPRVLINSQAVPLSSLLLNPAHVSSTSTVPTLSEGWLLRPFVWKR